MPTEQADHGSMSAPPDDIELPLEAEVDPGDAEYQRTMNRVIGTALHA